MRILIASKNKGKVGEIQSLLSGLDLQWLTLDQLGIEKSVAETGKTYAENAVLKAQKYAQIAGMITLSDDSGLEVDALDGAPGILSARFAPQPGATDQDRRRYLLQLLAEHPRPWKAHFHCTVAIITPSGGKPALAEGTCFGEIIPEERGTNGFGYDPIFLFPKAGRTMAELAEAEKNEISHRARAIRAAVPILTNLINQNL